MILIAGTVTLPEGGFDKVLPAARAMIAETLKEDGCIRYAFAQDIVDPTIMHIAEAWRDRAALGAHGASAHMKVWREAVGAVGVVSRDLRMYETGEGEPI